ncbi:g6539 [Coccomyxa viridis]|uniref:G6539 protein n=1 Tax=Coccomyxa viridis TaxID=1274662 RepID=A0ABP1FVM7_9CHLO
MQKHFRGLLGTTHDDRSELSDMVWLAELGMPAMKRLYELDGSFVDVFNDVAGIGCRLNWECSETEIYLYDSPTANFSEPLACCPIVDGEAQLPHGYALQSKRRGSSHPFGILPGSKLRQLVVNFLDEQYWAGMPGGRLEPQ